MTVYQRDSLEKPERTCGFSAVKSGYITKQTKLWPVVFININIAGSSQINI